MDSDPPEPVCEIDTTPYLTLDAALSAVAAGETKTIRLLKDIDYSGGIVITNKTITFDTNGHTLNVTNTAGNALEVGSGGVVNLAGNGAFNVTSDEFAVFTQDGGKATVTNATSTEFAVYAWGAGSYAEIMGDARSEDNISVYALNGAQIVVKGNATSTRNSGAIAYNGGVINVDGAVKGEMYGVLSTENSSVTAGSVEATGSGSDNVSAYAQTGGRIVINGDALGGDYGAWAQGPGSAVTIGGNATGTCNIGVKSDDGGKIVINGDTLGGDCGAWAEGPGSAVTVGGNARATFIGSGKGVMAGAGATIIVNGDATASGNDSFGAFAFGECSITIGGNVQGYGGVYAAGDLSTGSTIRRPAARQRQGRH